jgi:hypothetical protein
MAENKEKIIKAWIMFKNYIKNLHYFDNLLLIKLRHHDYMESLRLISEKYYDINTNLNIIINDKETIDKKILNEKIGLLNNNMLNLIKIVEKKNKKLIAEFKEHNTLLERFKSDQFTIQKYFMEEVNKELEQVKLEEVNQEQVKLEEVNQEQVKLEEVNQEQVKIIKDELNPNHIRFEYL